nr:protein STAY-GREEN 1, chloroplastic-like isoform X2 [Ipomoea batatas]
MGTLGASLLLPTKPIIGPEKKASQFGLMFRWQGCLGHQYLKHQS